MKQSRATLFGLPNSPEAYELRDFLKRSGFPFEWIDLKTDDDARRLNPSFNPLHPDNGISYLYEEPYSENRDLVLSGVFLEPAKLRKKKFQARLVRQEHLDKKTIGENLRRYEESPPKSVGGFSKLNLSIVAFLAIPDDAFALILQNAAAHKINFMTLRGQKLRYGHGDIYGYSLQEQQEEQW